MATKIISWRDFSDFKQSLKLDNVVYTLRARWNTVHEFWTIDLYDSNDTPLLMGQKLVFNTDILARYTDTRLPPGQLFCIDAGNELQKLNKIGRNDLGVNAFLVYEEI